MFHDVVYTLAIPGVPCLWLILLFENDKKAEDVIKTNIKALKKRLIEFSGSASCWYA